jgi:hypothetical protein
MSANPLRLARERVIRHREVGRLSIGTLQRTVPHSRSRDTFIFKLAQVMVLYLSFPFHAQRPSYNPSKLSYGT